MAADTCKRRCARQQRRRNIVRHLAAGRASGQSATAQPTSVPPLFAWRRNTGFGALVEFGRQRDHALNQGADFWNDGLQTPHFREFGDTKILFLPLVELP